MHKIDLQNSEWKELLSVYYLAGEGIIGRGGAEIF